jgi:uncharacterized metal-binding protein
MIAVLAFVFGWFAWVAAVIGGAVWLVMKVGADNLAFGIPACIVAAVLALGGLFVGLRLLVGEWAWSS